jgi:hypothetical protein
MPLDQLLRRVSAALGVSLQSASSDVGDVRVSVFTEDLPAERALAAVTSMLDLVPEGGFSWHRERRGERPGRSRLDTTRCQHRSGWLTEVFFR